MKVQIVQSKGGFQVVYRGDDMTLRSDVVPTLDEARTLMERIKSIFAPET